MGDLLVVAVSSLGKFKNHRIGKALKFSRFKADVGRFFSK